MGSTNLGRILFQYKNSFIVILISLVLFQMTLSRTIPKIDKVDVAIPAKAERWNPLLFQILSFGQITTVIDWYLLKTTTDTTSKSVAPGQHNPVYYDLEMITELDPLFLDVYLMAGYLLTVVQDDGVGARDLLLKGLRVLKEEVPKTSEQLKMSYWDAPWRIPVLLGYTYLFHLHDLPHAAEAFQEAAKYPEVPQYVTQLDKRLSRPSGIYEVGVRLLNFMAKTAKDSRVKSKLEKQQKDLYIAQYVFELNQKFIDYLKGQPKYSAMGSISENQMGEYFRGFLRSQGISKIDPWGGELKLHVKGNIVTSTPYETVLNVK